MSKNTFELRMTKEYFQEQIGWLIDQREDELLREYIEDKYDIRKLVDGECNKIYVPLLKGGHLVITYTEDNP